MFIAKVELSYPAVLMLLKLFALVVRERGVRVICRVQADDRSWDCV